MAFAFGFLIVVGLRCMHEPYYDSKCNLNSDPLSYIKQRHLGYLHNQILLTNRLIRSDNLSKISSSIVLSLPLTFLVVTLVIVGNSMISSQLEAGSIMVRAIKSIDEPSLPLRVYGPNRSAHRASQGVHITIQMEDVHILVIASYLFGKSCMTSFLDWMVIRIPFQHIAAFIVSLRWVCSGC